MPGALQLLQRLQSIHRGGATGGCLESHNLQHSLSLSPPPSSMGGGAISVCNSAWGSVEQRRWLKTKSPLFPLLIGKGLHCCGCVVQSAAAAACKQRPSTKIKLSFPFSMPPLSTARQKWPVPASPLQTRLQSPLCQTLLQDLQRGTLTPFSPPN